MGKAHIQIRKLTKTYGSGMALVRALDGVDLEIRAGEFTALAGPSGSGKTTLLNLIGCIASPSSGRIFFEGTDLTELTSRQKTEFRNHKIGFIFQDFNLVPVLSAYENVELPLQIKGGLSRGERDVAIREILERMGLGELLHRKPKELSGGQQQRVAIARALVKKPVLLLADEPTANLDSKTARDILELMRELNLALGTTCLFSTHDPMVMDFATRLVRLRDGQIDGGGLGE